MIRIPAISFFVLAAAAAAPAPRPADAEALLATDRSFAAASVAHGIRTAFLDYLARGAILFRPGPVEGRKWYEERPEVPGTLSWGPSMVAVAGSGDLGYTSGPWEYRPPEGAEGAVGTGHFVSVWRRQDDGAWKVVLDTGISHAPEPPREKVEILPSGHAVENQNDRAELLDNDRALTAAAGRSGAVAAYLGVGAEDMRLYREGHPPTADRKKLGELISEEVNHWEPAGGDLSRDGSLGYTYGTAFREKNGLRVPVASYLRIWRRNGSGAWRLALDVANPLPAPGDSSG